MTSALPGRPAPQLLLTVQEFADLLRCRKTRASELLRDGVVPSIKVAGTMRRIRYADVVAYIDSLEPSLPSDGEAVA